jgi:hypothetical protein
MWKRIAIAVSFIAVFSGLVSAEAPYTPPVGSAERQAILEALRPAFERELKQKVKFRVEHLKIFHDWAFIIGDTLSAHTGKAIGVDPHYDPNFCGLLRRQAGGTWKVVDHLGQFGDPYYAGWVKEHGAPLAIFPKGTGALVEH